MEKIFFDHSYVNWRFGKKLLTPSINVFSSASPCVQKKKYFINISQPYKWLKLLHFKKIYLNFVHINAGVWRSKLSLNSSTRDLLLNFVVKFKKKKKMFLRTNSVNLSKSLVGIIEEVCSSNCFLMLKSPLCVVGFDIDWPNLQSLERNP